MFSIKTSLALLALLAYSTQASPIASPQAAGVTCDPNNPMGLLIGGVPRACDGAGVLMCDPVLQACRPVAEVKGGAATLATTALPVASGTANAPAQPALPNACQELKATENHNMNPHTCKPGQLAASTFTPTDRLICPGVTWPANNFVAAYHNPDYTAQNAVAAGPPTCGKVISIRNKKPGSTPIEVTVVDSCPGCGGYPSGNGETIDLSIEAFRELFGMETGVYDVEYTPL
jgi:hypothetical protein